MEKRLEIKVLGPGCAKCNKVENVVREVVEDIGANADVEKVTDMLEISEYGIMKTPAVVVEGEVKIVGKIPTRDDIISWFGE